MYSYKTLAHLNDELSARLEIHVSDMRSHLKQHYRFRLEQEMEHIKLQLPDSLQRINSTISSDGKAAYPMLWSFLLDLHDDDPCEISEPIRFAGKLDVPDIDIDFSENDAPERVMQGLYGKDKVFHVATFSTRNLKGTIRDICRIFEIPLRTADLLTAPFGDLTKLKQWDDAMGSASATSRKAWTEFRYVRDIVSKLYGMTRHIGQHSAGRVFLPNGVSDLPLVNVSGKVAVGIPEGTSKRYLGELGYVKFDFLGLETLRTMRDVSQAVGAEDHFDSHEFVEHILHDPLLFEQFCAGNADNIFQFSSAGMISVLQEVQPKTLEDLTACAALYRPGSKAFIPEYVANKKHPDHIEWLCPELKPILDVTYGVIVYQEQIAEVFVKLGGFSREEAEGVRTTLKYITSANPTKSRLDEWERTKQKFLDQSPLEDHIAQKALKIIEHYAGYTFNKSHSLCYAFLALVTMFFKVYHAQAFYTSVIKMAEIGSKADKKGLAIRDVPDYIELLAPNIFRSSRWVETEGESIRLGLGGIRNVQDKDVDIILEWRAKNKGLTIGLEDAQVLMLNMVSKKTADALVLSNTMHKTHIQSFDDLRELLIKTKHYKQSTKAGRTKLEALQRMSPMKRDLTYFGTLIWSNPFRKLRGEGLFTLPSDLNLDVNHHHTKILALVFRVTKRVIGRGSNKGNVFYILDVGDDLVTLDAACFNCDQPPIVGEFVRAKFSRRNGRNSIALTHER